MHSVIQNDNAAYHG